MDLTDPQKQAVQKWASEGASLSDVQKRLASEFGLKLTYMDVRFLMLDLGASVKDKVVAAPAAKPAAISAAADDDLAGDDELGGPGGAGAVQVEIDRVMKPGSIVSGTVRFSDGVRASWALDQMGRLALDAGRPGYRPSEGDLHEFQVAVSRELQKRGF